MLTMKTGTVRKLFTITEHTSGDTHELALVREPGVPDHYEHLVTLADGHRLYESFPTIGKALRALIEQFEADNENLLEG